MMALDLRANSKRDDRVLVPNENTTASQLRKKKNSDVNKEHVCPYVGCTKRFNRPYRLKQHITARHTLEQKFPCLEFDCDRTYASKYKLHLHLKNYHGSKTLGKTSGVSKTEVISDSLVSQMNIESKETQEAYAKKLIIKLGNPTTCDFKGCSKLFSSVSAMRKHFKDYHVGLKENLFLCDSCERTFKSHSAMEQHWFCHLDIIPFKCPECNKSFGQKRYLKRHCRSSHIKYRCHEVECSKLEPFIGKPAFNDHIAQFHTELACCHCDEKFQTKFLIAHHMRVHLKAVQPSGPFLCPSCPKTYNFIRNLNEHIRVKHRRLRVLCSLCGSTLASAQKLQQHMKVHEPGYLLVKKVPKGAQRKQRKDAGVTKKTVSETFLQTSSPKIN